LPQHSHTRVTSCSTLQWLLTLPRTIITTSGCPGYGSICFMQKKYTCQTGSGSLVLRVLDSASPLETTCAFSLCILMCIIGILYKTKLCGQIWLSIHLITVQPGSMEAGHSLRTLICHFLHQPQLKPSYIHIGIVLANFEVLKKHRVFRQFWSL
jgi:hypothetical protein